MSKYKDTLVKFTCKENNKCSKTKLENNIFFLKWFSLVSIIQLYNQLHHKYLQNL